MYKFSCILVHSASSVCRQLASSLNTKGVSLFGSGGLQRTLWSSAVRHRETSASQTTSKKDFSHLPPLPGEDSPLRWDGKKFEELPIVHIKATYNKLRPTGDGCCHQGVSLLWGGGACHNIHMNARSKSFPAERGIATRCTHIQVTDSGGHSVVRTSCGTEGFKNIKKSTPVAAQTAGISAAAKATGKGLKFVRVMVKGLGPGRLSAVKGLTMGGLEVVSITDNTPVPHNGCRPRKARRT